MPDKSNGVENYSTWQHVSDLQSCLPPSLTLWQTCNLPLSPCYLAPILHWSASSYFRRCSVRHCLITELIVLSLETNLRRDKKKSFHLSGYPGRPEGISSHCTNIIWKTRLYCGNPFITDCHRKVYLWFDQIYGGLVDLNDRAVYSFWQRTKVQISYRLSSPM